MMSGIELLNYLQGLSEEVLDKFIIVTHPNGGRSTLDHASVMYVGHLELHLSPEPTEEEINILWGDGAWGPNEKVLRPRNQGGAVL